MGKYLINVTNTYMFGELNVNYLVDATSASEAEQAALKLFNDTHGYLINKKLTKATNCTIAKDGNLKKK